MLYRNFHRVEPTFSLLVYVLFCIVYVNFSSRAYHFTYNAAKRAKTREWRNERVSKVSWFCDLASASFRHVSLSCFAYSLNLVAGSLELNEIKFPSCRNVSTIKVSRDVTSNYNNFDLCEKFHFFFYFVFVLRNSRYYVSLTLINIYRINNRLSFRYSLSVKSPIIPIRVCL